MKKYLRNNLKTVILLGFLILGAVLGIILGDKAKILAPFGDLFMNLMFVIIVPLIFLTITTSIAKIKNPKRIGKLLLSIIVTFVVMSLIACAVGLVTTKVFKLVDPNDSSLILSTLSDSTESSELELNILERTVSAISVNDFSAILSKNNILALVVISILVGIAINKVGDKGEKLLDVLESANHVVLKLIDIIFLYAPIGLGCYFAALIGTFGKEIAAGYLKTFVIYTVVAILFYFIFYSLYAFIAGGKKGLINFWHNILPATATSISTCSSAASIPVNISCAKNIGVSDDIAETTIPLGTSFHKDGSVIGSVFKIMFLVYLFNSNVSLLKITGVALLANLLVTAVPVGGGTISEMLIITLMGFPVAALPILTIIATIIDPAATLLNVVGDTSASMLVSRYVDGKNWLSPNTGKKKKSTLKKIDN